jgi:phosphohistidine phosphatase
MRHAKAEPYAGTDTDRPLTDTGRRQATKAAQFLAGAHVVPDYALVSSAARTEETWSVLRDAMACTAEAEVSGALYGAEPETILQLLRELDDAHRTVLVVGHSPAVWQLAGMLVDEQVDPHLWGALLHGFPPSTVAIFEVDGSWSTLTTASARMTALHPKPG